MAVTLAGQCRAAPAPSRVPTRRLHCCSGRACDGELAAGGHTQLAVDVARMRTYRLDADLQGEGYLSVRASLLEQGEHLGLTLGQQVPTTE